MVSRRIDLTEHGDFSRPDISRFRLPTHSELISYMSSYVMSSDTFDKVRRWTDIFGMDRLGHNDERLTVFGIINYIRKIEGRCDRCGETLFPWYSSGSGLCQRCENILQQQFHRIPWKDEFSTDVSNNIENISLDLFSLK